MTPDDLARELGRDVKWVRSRLRHHRDRGIVARGDRWNIEPELAELVRHDARTGRRTVDFEFRDEPH